MLQAISPEKNMKTQYFLSNSLQKYEKRKQIPTSCED